MRLLSATVSLVALFAWLIASNHCAVAGLIPSAQEASAAHSHCGGPGETPAPEDKERDCDGSKCCKSLSAPGLALAKNTVGYESTSFVAGDYPDFEQSMLGAEHGAATTELDTGPPRASSFAESVLQRNILAHAPPVFA